MIASPTRIIIAPNPFINIRYIKAYFVLNILGDEACKLFQFLRNKYSRDKKKIEGQKVSGSSTDEVREANVEASETYSFLSWLDPYAQPRKTSSNYVTNVDTDNENQEDIVLPLHSCFRLVSTILGVPNLHTIIVFLACFFVISIRYSLLFFFFFL